MNPRKLIMGTLLVIFLLFVLPILYMALRAYSTTGRQVRFKFPEKQSLTEQAAIELTKQALMLDGKSSTNMRPVPTGHHDALSKDIIFAQNEKSHEGFVLWWIDRPEYTWEYQVYIRRQGGEVICTITKPSL